MTQIRTDKFLIQLRKDPVMFLAFAWIAGLLAGTYIVISADVSFFSLMRLVPDEPVSIVGLLSATLLPLLISVFAVVFSCRWLIYPTAVLEGFLTSYVGVGVLLGYGCTAWVPAAILSFSSNLGSCVVLCFWISTIRRPDSGIYSRLLSCASVLLCTAALNKRFIFPFLSELLIILEG